MDTDEPSTSKDRNSLIHEPSVVTSYKWADDISETDLPEQATVDLLTEAENSEKEWPTLSHIEDTLHEPTALIKQQGEGTQHGSNCLPSVMRAFPRETTMQTGNSGTGLTRIKKQRLDKSNEQLNARKRTRNKVPPTTREKTDPPPTANPCPSYLIDFQKATYTVFWKPTPVQINKAPNIPDYTYSRAENNTVTIEIHRNMFMCNTARPPPRSAIELLELCR
jgi:hypothetical protein